MSTEPPARPPLDGSRIDRATLETPDLHVEVVEESTSTNATVGARAREGAPDGLVVVAEHQTAGRGRLDRVWESPARATLTFSMLLRPTVPTRSWPWLPLLAGFAVAQSLRGLGYDAGVKWPNDVLINDRKVAGILVERIDTEQGSAAVVGIGLNTHLSESELPVPQATSLLLERGGGWVDGWVDGGVDGVDRTEVLIGVLTSLRSELDAWQAGGDHAHQRLAASYADSCVTIGRDVQVLLPGAAELRGRATAVDPSGQLVVDDGSAHRRVGAGDVVHVRPLLA